MSTLLTCIPQKDLLKMSTPPRSGQEVLSSTSPAFASSPSPFLPRLGRNPNFRMPRLVPFTSRRVVRGRRFQSIDEDGEEDDEGDDGEEDEPALLAPLPKAASKAEAAAAACVADAAVQQQSFRWESLK